MLLVKRASFTFSACLAFPCCYGKWKKDCCRSHYLVLKFLCAWGNPYLHAVFKLWCLFCVFFFFQTKKKSPKFMFCCLNVCSWNHWQQDQALSCFSLKQLVVACMWCCREIVGIVLSWVSTAQIHCLVTISEESAANPPVKKIVLTKQGSLLPLLSYL